MLKEHMVLCEIGIASWFSIRVHSKFEIKNILKQFALFSPPKRIANECIFLLFGIFLEIIFWVQQIDFMHFLRELDRREEILRKLFSTFRIAFLCIYRMLLYGERALCFPRHTISVLWWKRELLPFFNFFLVHSPSSPPMMLLAVAFILSGK